MDDSFQQQPPGVDGEKNLVENTESDAAMFHDDLSFPWRLFQLLEMGTYDHIISWVAEGIAFRIVDENALVNVVLPRFFNKMSKLKSFKRQLSAYGFSYIRSGKYQGACKSASVVRVSKANS